MPKYKKVKVRGHYVCKIVAGKGKGRFAPSAKCGMKKTAPKKRGGKRGSRGKASASARSKYYRDAGGRCRKHGKRGFVKDSVCKRYGK